MSKAEATIIDERIVLRSPYEMAERAKAVGGGRWHRESRTWRYPLSLDTCHGLRRAFGSRLEVATPLREWYVSETQKAQTRAQAASVGDAKLTRLPEVAPALASTLRADQRVSAAWVAEGWRGAGLLADHPGTGKTLGAIAGVLESGDDGPMLVLCPRLSVRAVWYRELVKWTKEAVYIARGTRAKRNEAIRNFMADKSKRKWLIIVAETLRVKKGPKEIIVGCSNAQCQHNGGNTKHHDFWNVVELDNKDEIIGYEYPDLFKINWSWVLVDESHKMFGSLTVVKGNLTGLGLKRLNTKRRLAITGTPFGKGGRIPGMFGTLHWLWPDEFTSYWRWVDLHFEVEEKTVRYGQRPVKKIGNLKDGADEANFLSGLGPRILRRTKAEVLPALPEKRRVDVWCESTPAQLRQQARLVNDGEIVGESGVITVDGVLAYITRGKQVASGVLDVVDEEVVFDHRNSCKIEMLIQKMEDRGLLDGSGDTKIIIASQFNELLKAVEANLDEAKVPYLKITGSVSDRKRDEAMELFQSDQLDVRVMILNSKAGGVSVTLDAADELHMLDEMWDPGDNEQLEDRIHRASRIHQATIYRYRTEGTIDEGIAQDVEGRRFEQYRVLDKARDVGYVRALVEGKK